MKESLIARAEPAISMPKCPRGVGSIIVLPESHDLLEGVRLQPFPMWPDDRGYFLEVARIGRGLVEDFPAASTQASLSISHPGTIKAFHFHRYQTDCWTVAVGMIQIALVDLRSESRTFGSRNTLFVGTRRPWAVRIPPGVAHGYKVIGSEQSVLVYLTDQFYNPGDEGRIPYNDAGINYDWETQHK